MSTWYLNCSPSCKEKPDTPRYLVTLDVGIGDAVSIGLSAIDQIIANDPTATGTIDILCNQIQAQLFACDPRVNRIIETSTVFFPGPTITQWLRGMTLDTEAAHVVHFLRQRSYVAIFPSIIAPGLYLRLRTPLMYPRMLTMAHNMLTFLRQEDIPVNTIARHMVNHYFHNEPPTATSTISLDKAISLYLSSSYVQQAMRIVQNLKAQSPIKDDVCKLLIIAPDTASAVTRAPLDLLINTLGSVLATCPQFIVYILPSYTEVSRASKLQNALRQHYPQRIFLMPESPRVHLLVTTALIDQADIFVTGDTGVMHLAAADKRLCDNDDTRFAPHNAVKIVALFGGTSPAYFGYGKRSTIVGRGRKEQAALRPGFSKESYDLRGRDLFDHITPQQVTNAILD